MLISREKKDLKLALGTRYVHQVNNMNGHEKSRRYQEMIVSIVVSGLLMLDMRLADHYIMRRERVGM
jgi:hypothetical protein